MAGVEEQVLGGRAPAQVPAGGVAEGGADDEEDPDDGPRNPRLTALTASTPTKIVANSRWGETQIQKIWRGTPWRSTSRMNSAPPGSTATTLSP